jgi:hypothetical protein
MRGAAAARRRTASIEQAMLEESCRCFFSLLPSTPDRRACLEDASRRLHDCDPDWTVRRVRVWFNNNRYMVRTWSPCRRADQRSQERPSRSAMRIVRDETSHTTRNRENVWPRPHGVGTRDSRPCQLRAASAPSRPDPCNFKADGAIEEGAVRSQAGVRLSDAARELQAECEGRMATGFSGGRSEMGRDWSGWPSSLLQDSFGMIVSVSSGS